MKSSGTNNELLPETARFQYIPGLDGIRALAVLIVLVAHLGYEHIVPGGFGVTVFFFISGFLITRLLLAESDKQSEIGLKAFYARRIVRLYPALLFMVLGTTAVYGIAGIGLPPWTQFFSATFYLGNVYYVFEGATSDVFVMPWTHLWSLAVEEHFYLMFPLLMVACKRNWRHAAYALVGVIGFAVAWRTFILTSTSLVVADYNYMMTDTRLDSIAWGCLLSILLHLAGDHRRFRALLGFVPTALAVVALLASLLIRDETFRYTVRYTLQGAALFVLVLNFYYWQTLRFAVGLFETRPFAWVGKTSYALYLLHVPIYDFIHYYFDRTPITLAITVVTSFALAAFSFHFVEQPFVALRRRFGSHVITKDSISEGAEEPALVSPTK